MGLSTRLSARLSPQTLTAPQHPNITRCSGAKPTIVCVRERGEGRYRWAQMKGGEREKEREGGGWQGGGTCVEACALSDMRKSVSSSSTNTTAALRFRLG
ncbi:Nucleoside triphosphate pyrophosphatase [Dissostichus eleginoides]|uniref:Nucleoside triphosphate pyrophosphatase n=1 Tax=Dissostichus eleginoides TaxID=100907 RepID=A0AAD9BWR0_DISEL|nr:Nucleoside triphosphate pyrophosphatase [Dissostichus eleginoides]